MEKVDKKFTWVIKNFSSLQSNIISDKFFVGGCKWHLSLYPDGNIVDNFLSLFLKVADYESLPSGWRINTRYCLIIVNQLSEKLSQQSDKVQHWFDEKSKSWGFEYMISLADIHAKDSGFLVNGELKIAVEIDVLEIIGNVEVNGFHILPSQVELVSRMFEKYPKLASELRSKNPYLKTCYMNLLLGLIDSLRQSPHELPNDVLDEAYNTLESLTVAGFNLDWLEKKLDQVTEMKERVKDGEIRRQGIEKELKDLKRKRSDLKAQLEKEKSEVLAAKTPISFI